MVYALRRYVNNATMCWHDGKRAKVVVAVVKLTLFVIIREPFPLKLKVTFRFELRQPWTMVSPTLKKRYIVEPIHVTLQTRLGTLT